MTDGSRLGLRLVRVAAPVALVAVLAGCGSSSQKTTTPPVATTTAATSAPTTAPPPTAPAATVAPTTAAPTSVPSTTTVPTGPVACTSAHLAVSLGSGGAGLGHAGMALRFRNTGTVTCVLHGYPGVAMLDASGHQVVQAERTPSGYLGGLAAGSSTLPTISVRPGQTASALLEGTDVPTGSASSCPDYPGVLVTPPNLTTSVRLKIGTGTSGGLPGCSTPQIHPVVAGTTGSQG